VELFGRSGAYANCWCMWWRVSSKEFDEGVRGGNRAALEALVADGREPGLLAYREGRPAGWCAVAPRSEFPRILRSPVLKPAEATGDDVWSVNCFYIARDARRSGVGTALLDAAVELARERGAGVLEGYPIDTSAGDRTRPAAELFTGTLDLFTRAGFDVVARRKPARPIVQKRLP
jgi:GNAT superfamily N-acetyltransferase